MNAAIYFKPDAYLLDGPKLMGRQSAGNGFLRAAVRAHAGEPLAGYATEKADAEALDKAVKALDPAARTEWIPIGRHDLLAARGALYQPDVNLPIHARRRLRAGPASYSICGVTHTLSSEAAAKIVADLLSAPVMPWDALICTSTAARGVVETLLKAEADYLAWRFGGTLAIPGPQLPVIPLGVHCEDFVAPPEARTAARKALGIAADEVVALFPGRLSFSAKAHPFQMFRGLEAAAQASGRKLVFLMAGQFPAKATEDGYRAGAREACPSVRMLFVDGKDAARFAAAWRAADLFLSISDNYQETFGITPVEAMAAGLPVIVSDWDGYKDTVRDGVDGFRIPTWAPAPGAGDGFAADYDNGLTNYDFYLSRTSTTVSADPRALAERLTALVTDEGLRRRMGEAGAARARQAFDWAVVYGQYQTLWRELAEVRAARAEDPGLRLARAPSAAAANLDPYRVFGHYPTRRIGPRTRIRAAAGATPAAYAALTGQMMLSFWAEPAERVERIFAALADGELTLAGLAERLQESLAGTATRIGRLAKMELVELSPPAGED